MATSPIPITRSSAAQSGVTDAVPVLKTDLGSAGRAGLLALAVGFGGFMLWAGFAPLDEGVPSQGQVAIDTKRKSVQHQTGGIVREVMVREGEQVKEGQLLVKLDEAGLRANLESIRQRYYGLLAMHSRLFAEQAGQATIAFPPDLQTQAKDPQIRQHLTNQEQLLRSRQAGLQAELQSIEENILGQAGLVQSYQAMLVSRRSQLALVEEELLQTRGLVKDGYAPRNRQLELERQAADLNATVAELLGNINRSQRAVAELRQRALARRQDYRKEVESQLAEVSRELPADQEKLRALREELTRAEIRSPASGQVVGLVTQTVGGVVTPGQKLMDVVPANDSLLLEARVLPHVIDRVRTGMPVDVRFSAFSNSPQLVVEGQLTTISADLLSDQQSGLTFYLARVAVTPEGMNKLGNRTMQPGMPVEIIIRTGERSLLTYLLHPLTKRVAAAMTEE